MNSQVESETTKGFIEAGAGVLSCVTFDVAGCIAAGVQGEAHGGGITGTKTPGVQPVGGA